MLHRQNLSNVRQISVFLHRKLTRKCGSIVDSHVQSMSRSHGAIDVRVLDWFIGEYSSCYQRSESRKPDRKAIPNERARPSYSSTLGMAPTTGRGQAASNQLWLNRSRLSRYNTHGPRCFPLKRYRGGFSTCGFVNLDMGPSFQSPCDNLDGK